MSIDRTTPATAVNAIAATQDMRIRHPQQEAETARVQATLDEQTDVKLSALTQQMKADTHGDINYTRVAAVRAALEAGELPIDPENIARSLVMDIFQFN
ncbi:flagellar biosynthesis anti-sigma factor FlgM [Erwinia aphidicola]|uniref:flagellar biosynthesis anti-sigma factor FlgM n=1 Tax=Erwinia aphidicola TaxID=68334 RepID=UPI0030175641